MKGNRAALAVVVVLVLIAGGWWLFGRGGGSAGIDLLGQLQAAEKRPASGTFETVDADLNGQKHKAIYTVPESRIIWKVTVPDDAWLRVLVGMKTESWAAEGDGVLFRVGVSDGRTYEELFTQHLNPFRNTGDRKWVPVMVDLSQYAGEELQIIFNTNKSTPASIAAGNPVDDRNDFALWGAPEIITR